MSVSKVLKSLAICCCGLLIAENSSNATLHEINQPVFQHNVTIRINGDYFYKFYIPEKIQYFVSDSMQYVADWFRDMDSCRNGTNEKFLKVSDDSNHNEYYHSNSYIIRTTAFYYYDQNYQYLEHNIENKFNQLYQAKIDNNLQDDVITSFEKEIKKIFGENYSLCKDWRYDLERKDKTVILEDSNGINKVYNIQFDGTFEDLMRQNGFELVTVFKNYHWSGDYINNNNEVRHFNCDSLTINFGEDKLLIISRSSNDIVIVYNPQKHTINIYCKGNVDQTKIFNELGYDVTDKFRELGIRLYERYNREKELISEVFESNISLIYKIRDCSDEIYD